MEKSFKATLYGAKIEANTITDLKRKASRIANNFCKTIDEMTVTIGTHAYKMTRINKKCPWGIIYYGKWK
jgi:hypothetical protein